MKKFKFRLEAIMKLREFNLNKTKIAYNEVVETINHLESEKEQLLIKREERYNIQGVKDNYNYQIQSWNKEALLNKIEHINQEIVRTKELEVIRRKDLQTALQEMKVLEKLKEKKHVAYIEQMNKNEQLFYDELSLNKYHLIG